MKTIIFALLSMAAARRFQVIDLTNLDDLEMFLEKDMLELDSKVCQSGQVKTFLIDASKGECGETCLKSSLYKFARAFQPSLKKAASPDEPVCAKNGFTTFVRTEKVKVPTLSSINVDIYSK